MMEMPRDIYMVKRSPAHVPASCGRAEKPCFAFEFLPPGALLRRALNRHSAPRLKASSRTMESTVGMFPKIRDEVGINAEIVTES